MVQQWSLQRRFKVTSPLPSPVPRLPRPSRSRHFVDVCETTAARNLARTTWPETHRPWGKMRPRDYGLAKRCLTQKNVFLANKTRLIVPPTKEKSQQTPGKNHINCYSPSMKIWIVDVPGKTLFLRFFRRNCLLLSWYLFPVFIQNSVS